MTLSSEEYIRLQASIDEVSMQVQHLITIVRECVQMEDETQHEMDLSEECRTSLPVS